MDSGIPFIMMQTNYRKLLKTLFLLTIAHLSFAQMQITYPFARMVFQRGASNQAVVSIAGNYSQKIDRVEARFTPMQSGQGTATNWSAIQFSPQGGVFSGSMSVSAGWYKLEVRGLLNGNQVGNVTSLDKVGVGEVFVIAGQSNAQGYLNDDLGGSQFNAPGATDDRVNCIDYYNVTSSAGDQPVPAFSQMRSQTYVAPRGQSAWCWGVLGDLIAARYNVPVLFYNAGWPGTAMRNWQESAAGQATRSIYNQDLVFPSGMPYANLKIALQQYSTLTGMRAVLWHQGETDAIPLYNSPVDPTTIQNYRTGLQYIINKARSDAGKNVSWAVARVSLNFNTITQGIIDAQNLTISTTSNVFAGPNTDGVQNPRTDGVHFFDQGHTLHAQAWNTALDNNFFVFTTPQSPAVIPQVAVTCASNGNLTLTLPAGYASYLWSSGQTSRSITVGAGTYYARLRDALGNTVLSQTITVPSSNQISVPVITADGSTTLCSGSSVKLTSSNPSDNIWSNGATTQSITVNTPGTYTVSVQNTYGCTFTSNPVTISTYPTAPPAAPIITANGATTFCTGGAVALQSNYTGRTIWSTGFEGTTITINTTGSYYARSVDANGCSSPQSLPVNITVASTPTKPTISTSGPTSLCSGNSVTLTSNYTTGNTWSTGNTSQSIAVTSAGTYKVTYRDQNGCVSPESDPVNVTVNPLPAPPIITPQSSTTFCQGGSVVLTSSLGNVYSWSNGSTSPSIEVTTVGTFSLYIIDINGCKSPQSAAITTSLLPLPAPPTISATGATSFCPGGSVTLQSTFSGKNSWSNGVEGQNISVTSTGNYFARAVDANGCQSPASQTITVTVIPTPNKPVITASGPTSFCAGGSVTLNSSYATGNTWSNGSTTPSVTVSAGGTFKVSYRNDTGCPSPDSDPITVTVNSLPPAAVITPQSSTTFCQGESVTLQSSQAAAYLWSTGEITQSIKVFNAGEFSVTITDANGCKASISASVRTTVNTLPTPPTISANGATTFCPGGSVTLLSNFSGKNIWSSNVEGQTITVNSSGIYTVQSVDINGCKSPVSNGVAVTLLPSPPKPIITADGPTSFCAGGSVVLTSNYPTNNSWTTTATSQSITVNSSGVYKVTFQSTAGCPSPESDPVTVTVNPIPSAPIITPQGATTFCQGETVTLTSSPAAAYFWSTGETTQNIKAANSTDYSLYIIDSKGCKSPQSSSIRPNVRPLPTPPTITAGGPTTFCPGSSVILTSSAGVGYVWLNVSTNTTVGTTQGISVDKTGYYVAKVTDANGCTSLQSSPIQIILLPTPATPTISATGATTFCQGGSVVLVSSPGIAYSWSSGATTQNITVNTTGFYTLTVKDANGCVSNPSNPTAVVVNALPLKPSITASSATTFCQGESVVLSTAQQSRYRWNNGLATQSITVISSGKFAVQVTDSNGCTSPMSDTTAITVNPLPTKPVITASGPTTFCADKSVELVSSTETGYKWSNGATTRNITASTAGTFTVRTVNNFGCTSLVSDPVTTQVNPLPAAPKLTANGPLEFCDGGSVQLCADADKVIWNNNETTKCITATKTGEYFASVTDANGCVSAKSNALTISAKLLPDTPIISQIGAYTLEATGAVVGDDYQWELDGKVLSFNTRIIKAPKEGSYLVRTRKTYPAAPPVNQLTCLSKASSDNFRLTLNPNDKGFTVYPNPSSTGLFTLETREDLTNAEVLVYVLTGELVYQGKVDVFNDRKSADLRTLPTAPYILRIKNANLDASKLIWIVK
ncbi:MAG: sialate O-acetylesterase [Spirosomataceae bacterium]